MTTELGKFMRKIRIDKDERLFDMAKRLGVSSAFISAIELGKKSPPEGFEEKITSAYDLQASAAQTLHFLADRERKSFTLEPRSQIGRDTAGMLARRINSLSDADLAQIQKILKRGQ